MSSIDIGAPVVRMSYSPTSSHAVVAILEVGSVQNTSPFRLFGLY